MVFSKKKSSENKNYVVQENYIDQRLFPRSSQMKDGLSFIPDAASEMHKYSVLSSFCGYFISLYTHQWGH